MAVEKDKNSATRFAFVNCIPIVKGRPDHLVPTVSNEVAKTMETMLLPYGEPHGRYDNISTFKGCLMVSDSGRRTIFFLVPSGEGTKVASVEWHA
jgi:hypothetical protein